MTLKIGYVTIAVLLFTFSMKSTLAQDGTSDPEEKKDYETFVFPKTVYLEKTASTSFLNFDIGFKAKHEGMLRIITYEYLDAEGAVLLKRRLAAHQLDNVARFVGVFGGKPKFRAFDNKFRKGETVFISHPYNELPREYEVATILCTGYFAKKDSTYDKISWKIPIETFESKVSFGLPFKEKWLHLEGHDAFSHHRQIYVPRNSNFFALDLMKVDEKGRIAKGDGTKNEEFYSWGAPVLSPADGKIVIVKDGTSDNPVGGRAKDFTMQNPGGNVVIIEHQKGVYSYLAHFKKGSIRVKAGDSVKKGKLLGLCGNSGNSDAPHIHFHLMTKASLGPFECHGLPIVFEKYDSLVGRKVVRRNRCGSYPGEILIGRD